MEHIHLMECNMIKRARSDFIAFILPYGTFQLG